MQKPFRYHLFWDFVSEILGRKVRNKWNSLITIISTSACTPGHDDREMGGSEASDSCGLFARDFLGTQLPLAG